MYIEQKQIFNEIGEKISEGKGCIVFDFGCYFPYSNQDVLTFNFKIGEEKLEQYKCNHRYPNKGYVTISKKMGRKVSKLGYPYFVDLDEEQIMLLEIEVGIRDNTLHLIFPINVKLTKDKPVCSLTWHFYFNNDKANFDFTSYYKCKDGGWKRTVWTNREIDGKDVIYMDIPTRIEDTFTALYHDVISPYPQTMKDLRI